MSTADLPPVHDGLPHGGESSVAPAPPDDPVRRVRTAQRWAVGVLLGATVALVGYLALLIAFAWLLVSAYGAVGSGHQAALDLSSAAADVLPGLLVAWCSGLAATTMLARGEALGPRAAGILSGLLGVVAGSLVLLATGIF
jgi:hypothetical protein